MTESSVDKKERFSIGQFLTEVRGEIRKVVWPDRPLAIRLTGIVLMVTALMSAFLYAFDYLFGFIRKIVVDLFLGV